MIEQYVSESVAQLIWTAAMVLAFGGMGALRTYYSARQNDQQWEWEQGKYEVIALGGAGALAGVYVFTVGGSLTDPIFGTAVTVAALMARKAYLIKQDTEKRYDTLTDAGVEADEAALLSIKYGIEQNNPEEISKGMTMLLNQGGQPSVEKAQQNVEETREQAEDGELDLEPDVAWQVDDWDEETEPAPPEATPEPVAEGEDDEDDEDGEMNRREFLTTGDSDDEESSLPPA